MNVRQWMTEAVQTIAPTDLLEPAAERMRQGRFRRLPVVDDEGNLVGMLSERDVREHHGYLPVTRVRAAMTEQPITIDPEAPVELAANLLLEHKIGGLPVMSNDGKVIGIITETDLLRGLLQGIAGGERTSTRIDFEFTNDQQTFAGAVAAVEKAGGTILGLGTMRGKEEVEPGSRLFFLRVLGADVDAITEALAKSGYTILQVHRGPA